MTDPNAAAAALARGSAVDLGTFSDRREADKLAAGVMLALANLPVFERIAIGGRVTDAAIDADVMQLTMQGVGSTTAYVVQLPVPYLRQAIAELDQAASEAASSEGEKPEEAT